MKKSIVILVPLLLLFACVKLDSNLYNKKKLSSYELDNYTGEQDFVLDGNYKIADDKISQLTLASQTATESSPTSIRAIYLGDPSRIATDTIILYCHGNKWHMDFYWQRAKLLAHVNGKLRYGVMMMDYRGFGLSDGVPTEEGMYADVDACMKWLKDHGLSSDRLIIYGFSLGSASACELTARPRTLTPSKLILESPFGSAAIMVQDAAQLNMPAEYFTDLKINNADAIKLVQQPFFWMHGMKDNFLNYKTHGQTVYDHYQGRYKDCYLVPEADHGNVVTSMGFEAYLAKVGAFIRHQ